MRIALGLEQFDRLDAGGSLLGQVRVDDVHLRRPIC